MNDSNLAITSRNENFWEQRKLGKQNKITMGQSPSSKNYTDNPNDWILIQGNADLKNGKVTPRLYTSQVTKKADIGDIILTVRAPVGEVAITDYKAILGRGVASIKGNLFIYFALEKFKTNNKWNMYSSGSTFDSITGKDLNNLALFFPSKMEENKIGKLLNKLDSLLALYERKYRQLQTLKSGLLQNIFNNFNSGNTVRLNQICVLKQWKTISSQKMKKKGYPVFGANGIIGYYDKYNHEKPTICITCRGATSGNILISKPYSYITGNAMCLENLSSDFNIKFLYEYLSYRGLKDVITGSAQPQITSSLLGIVKIPIVPLKKQKSISNVLLSLDSIINNIQMKSSYLKKIKETLLNTMFI